MPSPKIPEYPDELQITDWLKEKGAASKKEGTYVDDALKALEKMHSDCDFSVLDCAKLDSKDKLVAGLEKAQAQIKQQIQKATDQARKVAQLAAKCESEFDKKASIPKTATEAAADVQKAARALAVELTTFVDTSLKEFIKKLGDLTKVDDKAAKEHRDERRRKADLDDRFEKAKPALEKIKAASPKDPKVVQMGRDMDQFKERMKSDKLDEATKLIDALEKTIDKPPVAAPLKKTGKQMSGAHWVSQFPTSRSTSDLASPFRANAQAFIKALEDAKADVSIAATLRPPERAQLMYWSWMVGKSLTDPTKVPKISGVNIDWDHGDKDTSIKAAKAMIAGYDIMYKPSLTSRHLKGFAIDMTITGIVGKTMKNQKGEDVEVKTVQKLYDIGAGYGVKKLVSDPPHWSDTGG